MTKNWVKRTSFLKIYKDESLECGLNSTEVWMMKEYMQALEGWVLECGLNFAEIWVKSECIDFRGLRI